MAKDNISPLVSVVYLIVNFLYLFKEPVKPHLLNSNIFPKDKNIAFAFLKDFFIKYDHGNLTNERVSDALTTDVTNMMQHLNH